jgi:hypothetical protein
MEIAQRTVAGVVVLGASGRLAGFCSTVPGRVPGLTRGLGQSAAQQAAHAELAGMSRAGQHIVAPDPYHEIHLSHPEVVVKAVSDVIAGARRR